MSTEYPFGAGSTSPFQNAFEITPGAGDLTNHTRAIYVGGAGDIVIVTNDDEEVTLFGALVGTVINIRAKKVLALAISSGGSPSPPTTATNLVGLY